MARFAQSSLALASGFASSAVLNASDVRILDEALKPYCKTYEAGTVLVEAGTVPKFIHVVLSGWMARYKHIRDRRQIVALFLPKDLADPNFVPFTRSQHETACLTAVVAAELSHETLAAFLDGNHPLIAQAFKERAAITNAIQQEWLVNVGIRSAPERIAHLLCELFHRLRAVGMTVEGQFALPLTQGDIADALGLSLVHVNKRLRDLTMEGLISMKRRLVTIHDVAALERLALFDPAYLHLHIDNGPASRIAHP